MSRLSESASMERGGMERTKTKLIMLSSVCTYCFQRMHMHASTDAKFQHRAQLGLGITSMSHFSIAKTIPGSACYAELYRMFTNVGMSSWVDLCLYPIPNMQYQDVWCENCPVGPYLDYTYLVRQSRYSLSRPSLSRTAGLRQLHV